MRIYRAIYWTFCVLLASSIAWCVTVQGLSRPAAGSMTDEVSLDTGPESTEGRACVTGLRLLYEEVRDEATRRLALEAPTDQTFAEWRDWTSEWRERMVTLSARCGLRRNPKMAPVRQLAEDVERVQLAYTTALKSFSDLGRKPVPRMRAAFETLGVRDASR